MGSAEPSVASASVEHLPALSSAFSTLEALFLRANPSEHPVCKSLPQSLCYRKCHLRQTLDFEGAEQEDGI